MPTKHRQIGKINASLPGICNEMQQLDKNLNPLFHKAQHSFKTENSVDMRDAAKIVELISGSSAPSKLKEFIKLCWHLPNEPFPQRVGTIKLSAEFQSQSMLAWALDCLSKYGYSLYANKEFLLVDSSEKMLDWVKEVQQAKREREALPDTATKSMRETVKKRLTKFKQTLLTNIDHTITARKEALLSLPKSLAILRNYLS